MLQYINIPPYVSVSNGSVRVWWAGLD